ncbi:hypothetical protein OUZ56_009371 [Daphnia magna]|uniref:Uncharacterized protein n=1 Tax=Daphnia magna TaxID=35525 RepID=A0ABR0AFZ0_9CRUS|nr:hypothetical protein OUZ56_009371 [Daphnia magna]
MLEADRRGLKSRSDATNHQGVTDAQFAFFFTGEGVTSALLSISVSVNDGAESRHHRISDVSRHDRKLRNTTTTTATSQFDLISKLATFLILANS